MNFYNEIDNEAADWLEELIRQGEIPAGVVDRRDIRDIRPDELHGYTQCHFFAGIGGWPLALRLAGWPDDRPVWTGSCPCQPFSTAGRGDGFVDERHLWPHWHHHISQCQPEVVFGEQVASKDGLAWLDLVYSDLEGTGYAFGPTDLCAAGVGAPHIRQRLWIGAIRMADTECLECGALWVCGHRKDAGSQGSWAAAEHSGNRQGRWMADLHGDGRDQWREGIPASWYDGLIGDSPVVGMVHGLGAGLEGLSGHGDGARGRALPARSTSEAGQSYGLDNGGWTGPTNGFWRSADWLFCRDDKWRPVEPCSFPLADGIPARVGRLRGYGNAIVPWAGKAYIEAFCEVVGIPLTATGMGAVALNCHI